MQSALYTRILQDRKLETVFDITSALGYDGTELMGSAPHIVPDMASERAEELKNRLDTLGLEVPCLYTYTGDYTDKDPEECQQEIRDLEPFLELADIFDCDLVRHKVGGPSVLRATDRDFERAAQWLRRACDLAADHHKNIGLEIHAGRLTETATSTRRLLDMIDRPNVGTILDAGNMYIVDTEYGREALETLGEDILHVHVKDERRVQDLSLTGAWELETHNGVEAFQPCLLGEGEVDYANVFQILDDMGYGGFLSCECHVPQGTPDADIKIANHEIEEMRKLLEHC